MLGVGDKTSPHVFPDKKSAENKTLLHSVASMIMKTQTKRIVYKVLAFVLQNY